MTLSVKKLEELLENSGFVPVTYYVVDGQPMYIEISSQRAAEVCLLYIPSKYNFRIDKNVNYHKLRYIDLPETDTTEEYGEGKGTDIPDSIELSPDPDGEMAEQLEKGYRHPIKIRDISKDDLALIRSVSRQLNRLKYCVESIRYKIGVGYKNYLTVIRRDNSVESYSVKNRDRSEEKRLFVIIDLEMFYTKTDAGSSVSKIISDTETVRLGIYGVLAKNQGIHSRVIDKLLTESGSMLAIADEFYQSSAIVDKNLSELEDMLKVMKISEEKKATELSELISPPTQDKGLNYDIAISHKRSLLEKELSKIDTITGSITKNILEIRHKKETTLLSVDKIMFDNAVMFDTILKNFGKLKAYI